MSVLWKRALSFGTSSLAVVGGCGSQCSQLCKLPCDSREFAERACALLPVVPLGTGLPGDFEKIHERRVSRRVASESAETEGFRETLRIWAGATPRKTFENHWSTCKSERNLRKVKNR